MAGAIGPPRAEPDRAPTIPQLAGSRLGDKIQWTSPNLLEPAGTACARNKLSFYGAVLKVRIHLPPAVSQGRTRPRGLALLEATIVSERPMMGVFNNLVVFDQHVKQNSLNSIVPDLADEVGPTLLQRQRERSRPAGPCQRS